MLSLSRTPIGAHRLSRPPLAPSPRYASGAPQKRPSWAQQNTYIDPRPSWVLAATRLSTFAVVPATLFYAVFFADFGEREHVFMPARRWMAARTSAFFSLSDAEREVAGVADEALLDETAEAEARP